MSGIEILRGDVGASSYEIPPAYMWTIEKTLSTLRYVANQELNDLYKKMI